MPTLVENYPIPLLDEATLALNKETKHKIKYIFINMNQQLNILVIANRVANVLHEQCIVCLDGGQLIELGCRDKLMLETERYAQLRNLQLAENGKAIYQH